MKKFLLSLVIFVSLFICSAKTTALAKETFGSNCISAWHCDTKVELDNLIKGYTLEYFQPVSLSDDIPVGYYVEFVNPAFDPSFGMYYGFVIEQKKGDPVGRGYIITR